MIAQVHGYCLGGALGIMNCHDLVFAAEDAQLGMPEDPARQLRPAGHLDAHSRPHPDQEGGADPARSAATSAASRPTVSASCRRRCQPAELERTVNGIAREIASRHLATLEHAKIAVQMDRDLSLSQAIQLDMLVGARMQSAMDPTGDVNSYLQSQKGGPNTGYKRPDV